MSQDHCRTCGAEIVWATLHNDGRRLPYDAGVVDAHTPDSDIHVSTGQGRKRTVTAWDLPGLAAHLAQSRVWTDTRAAAFAEDAWPAHRRHRCHQQPAEPAP